MIIDSRGNVADESLTEWRVFAKEKEFLYTIFLSINVSKILKKILIICNM